MVDKFETNNPILKTIQIVEDRIAEIHEEENITNSITQHGKLVFYERLAKDLQKLYTGNISRL